MASRTENRDVVPSSGELVLIGDDDPDSRAVIGHALEALQYRTVFVEDGEEAKEAVLANLPDLAVMDIMMPRTTGIDFVRWLRKNVNDHYVPVLLVTALDDIGHRVEGLTAGADDYLIKPYHHRELQARVQALLRVKALTDALRKRGADLEQSNRELKIAQAAIIQHEREIVAAQMAATVAHRLGQPLTSILLHCNMIERILEGEHPSLRHELQGITTECHAIHDGLEELRTLPTSKSEIYVGEVTMLGSSHKPQAQ